jgi:hypothetical protein
MTLLHAFLIVGLGVQPAPATPFATEAAAFNAIDTNHDDVITKDELRRFLAALLRGHAIGAGIVEAPDFQVYIDDLAERGLNFSLTPGDIVRRDRFGLLLQLDLTPIAKTLRDMLVARDQSAPPTSSWVDTLADWIDVRQSFLEQQGIGKPAKISLMNRGGDDETVKTGDPRRIWSIQSAVVFNSVADLRFGRISLTPTAAYEFNVTSNTPAKDQIAHRLGVTAIVRRRIPTGPFPTHMVQATVDYKTDRRYDARVWGATVQYTPFWRQIGIGRYLRHGAPVDFRWQPEFGWVHGNVDKPGGISSFQQMADFDNLFGRLTGELRLGPRWRVTPQISFWHTDQTQRSGATLQDATNVRSLASRWILSQSKKQESSFEVSVTGGRDAPDFKRQQLFQTAFGFKF